jgi:hypothetical protein
MVGVFKTNVQGCDESKQLIQKLLEHFPYCAINFDLEDCDKILRIEGDSFCDALIISLLGTGGYQCEALV